MAISVNYDGSKLKIKVLAGDQWNSDLEKIKSIEGRKWNKEDKVWEVSPFRIYDLKDKWNSYQIIGQTEWIKQVIAKEKKKLEPIIFLPDGYYELPTSGKKVLKEHQLQYIRIPKNKKRLLCAFSTGCGKTLAALVRAKLYPHKRLLIVAPKTMKAEWPSNVRDVLGVETIVYWAKTKKAKSKILDSVKACGSSLVLFATYETVGDISKAIEDGSIEPFDSIIIDEAHLICNPDSKRFKDLSGVVYKHPDIPIQALSGTPIQHKVQDLWSILHFLEPEVVGGYDSFCNNFTIPIRTTKIHYNVKDFDGKEVIGEDGNPVRGSRLKATKWLIKNKEGLKQLLSHYCYRVRREDVVDFDGNLDIIKVEMTESQRDLYERLRTELIVDIGDRRLSLKEKLVRMGRLLQATEGIFNFSPGVLESGKLEFMCHELDNASDQILGWSRFQPMTEILYEKYKDRAVIYNGKQSDDYKDYAKWAFGGLQDSTQEVKFRELKAKLNQPFEPGEAQFFFGTIDMRSALGMNLHKNCWKQIFTSFSWLGAANFQAADRLRRIGQQADKVFTQFLVAEKTFEERALELVLNNYKKTVDILDGIDSLSSIEVEELIEELREAA